jgi:hypothetical protein
MTMLPWCTLHPFAPRLLSYRMAASLWLNNIIAPFMMIHTVLHSAMHSVIHCVFVCPIVYIMRLLQGSWDTLCVCRCFPGSWGPHQAKTPLLVRSKITSEVRVIGPHEWKRVFHWSLQVGKGLFVCPMVYIMRLLQGSWDTLCACMPHGMHYALNYFKAVEYHTMGVERSTNDCNANPPHNNIIMIMWYG